MQNVFYITYFIKYCLILAPTSECNDIFAVTHCMNIEDNGLCGSADAITNCAKYCGHCGTTGMSTGGIKT